MGNMRFQERTAEQENEQDSDCAGKRTVNDELTDYKCSDIV